MNRPSQTPDYGEPWQATTAREGSIITCDDRPIFESYKLVKRAVVCVNACAGMADPAAEIQAMRDAIKEAHDALETAQRQWSHYAEFRDNEDLETAKHHEGHLYRAGQTTLAKLKPFTTP